MPATYEKIATTTLGSAAADITFSGISSAFTDLKLVLTGTATSLCNLAMRFNTDTATNYSTTYIYGDGTSATSGRRTSATRFIFTDSTNWDTTIPNFFTCDIFSYAGSTFKTCLASLSQDLNGSGSIENIVALYRSTSAITTIELLPLGTTFKTGTTATIYGILKA